MAYRITATVEQHRRDYMGVLANPPARKRFVCDVDTLAATIREAKAWATPKIGPMQFGVIEGDGVYLITGTDNTEWNDS